MGDDAVIVSTKTLSVAAWERYMAVDYGPHHTMTCFVRFWFAGTLDRQRFSEAVAKLAEIHPLLAVQLKAKHWVTVPFDADQQIDWQESATPVDMAHLEPDDFLVRFIVRVGHFDNWPDDQAGLPERLGTLLVVKYQHAVSDGMGVFVLLKQIRNLMEGKRLEQPPTSPSDQRHHFGLTSWQRLRRAKWDSKRILAYFWRFPISFKTDQLTGSKEIRCECHRVSKLLTEQIRQRARLRGVSVNDLMVATLFRTISNRVKAGTIRIGVPIAMRPKSNQEFCNLVSMVFLDRSNHQSSGNNLLDGIAVEMRDVQSKQLGHAMISFLQLACIFRGILLQPLLRVRGCAPTAVLTNLGKPFSKQAEFYLGTARLKALDSLAPLRPGTDLALSVNEFGGRLSFSLRYNVLAMTALEAQELVSALPAQMVRILDEKPVAD